jgi:antitoxin Phd
MKLYTYSDARQQFASVLDTASREGKVLIRKRDGSLFALVPEPKTTSPFDVEGLATDVSAAEIVSLLREERAQPKGSTC